MSSWIEYTPPKWRNLRMRALEVDQAYIVPVSSFPDQAYIYTLSDECYTCPYEREKAVSAYQTEEVIKRNVAHAISFKVFENDVGRYAPNNASALCTLQTPMREFGVYNLTIHSNGTCDMITDNPGVNVNLSILSVILLVALVTIITKLSSYALRRISSPSTIDIVSNTEEQEVPDKPVKKKRLRSLDAFRGLVIILMIFVNTSGGGYWWINHAPWNGLHIADVVFPSFLWIMGVCIPISTKSQLSRGTSKKSIYKKIISRSIKMFLIGLCLNSTHGPNLVDLRIMGVLQRFGVAFLVVGIVHTIFARSEYVLPQSGCQRSLFDLVLLKEQLIFMLGVMGLSLGVMFGVSAPGCPRGYIGPGGMDANAAYPDCIGGIAGFIDRVLFGESHVFQHARAMHLYNSLVFDPEGLFGCLLTIVHVFFGVICGTILITYTEWTARIKRWIVWGVSLGLLGGILCCFSEEGGLIPVNKNLWSLSFVLVTCSMAFLVLSIFYYVIDVREMWAGYPLAESGMNAILLYVGHTVFHKMLPWSWAIGAMNTHFVLLLKSLWTTLLWIGTAVYLDRISFYYIL